MLSTLRKKFLCSAKTDIEFLRNKTKDYTFCQKLLLINDLTLLLFMIFAIAVGIIFTLSFFVYTVAQLLGDILLPLSDKGICLLVSLYLALFIFVSIVLFKDED